MKIHQQIFAIFLVVLAACSSQRGVEQLGETRQALTGLVASYSFNEGAGTSAADGSGNGNTGTLNGAAWTTSGKYGGALTFNGTSARVDVADSASLDVATAWTVAAWVRPTSVSDWRTVVMKEYSTSALGLSYALYASDGAGRAWAGFSTTSATRSVEGGTITANAWQHIATTYDGSTLRLYKDGVQVTSGAASGNPAATTSALRIGGNAVPGWGEYFAGTIDEVQIYSRALSASEVVVVRDTPLDSSGGGGGTGGTGGTGGSSGSGGAGAAGGGAGGAGESGGGSGGAGAGGGGAAGAAGAGGASGGSAGSAGSGGTPASNATLNGAVTYQTMDGFGTSINAHGWDNGAVAPALTDLNDMGTRIWRVVYDMTDWESTNDNADPATFNWTSYNAIFTSPDFEELWSTIAWLNAHGHTSGVMLDFMGRVPTWMGGATLNTSLKDEFVETVIAATYYGRVTRGLQFGMLAPLNETDWDGIEGPQISASDYGDVMNRIAVRLDALAMSDLKLVGPDTAGGGGGVDLYIPAMLSRPTLMAHVDAFALHEYNAVTVDGIMERIAGSAYPNRRAWVTETNDFNAAWFQIGAGISSVLLWEGYDSVYQHAILAGRGSVAPNDGAGPAALSYSNGTYARQDQFYAWKHLAKYIAPGAVRIGVTKTTPIDLYAFRHPASGEVTVLGRNFTGAGQTLRLNLGGLTSGTVQCFASNPAANWATLPVTVSGGVATVDIPYDARFTLVASGTSADTTPPDVALQQLTLTVSASDASGIAGVQFMVDGVNLGSEDTVAPYSASWTAASGSHVLSYRARDAAGNLNTKSTSVVVP